MVRAIGSTTPSTGRAFPTGIKEPRKNLIAQAPLTLSSRGNLFAVERKRAVPVTVAVWDIEVPVWQIVVAPVWAIVEAPVTVQAVLATAAARANWVGRTEADPGVEAVLLKALIAAEARRGARASVAARADQALVEVVAVVDPVAVVVVGAGGGGGGRR